MLQETCFCVCYRKSSGRYSQSNHKQPMCRAVTTTRYSVRCTAEPWFNNATNACRVGCDSEPWTRGSIGTVASRFGPLPWSQRQKQHCSV